jgi:hypothetical protein
MICQFTLSMLHWSKRRGNRLKHDMLSSQRLQRSPRGLPEAPEVSQRSPRGLPEVSQRSPRGLPEAPEVSQRSPRGLPEVFQRSPRGLQRSPRGLPEVSQRLQRSPRGSRGLPACSGVISYRYWEKVMVLTW